MARVSRQWLGQRGVSGLRSLTSILVVLAAWEIIARLALVPPLLFPPFSIVVTQLWRAVVDLTLPADLALSLMRAFAGLALAAALGICLGLSMARSRIFDWFFDPVVALGFPAPKIAFLPIFVLWFGIESMSKILLVAFASIFPIVIGSYSAAKNVNKVWVWSAASLGSAPRSIFFRVLLPACFPRIFTTLRVATPVALITTFTAEMVAGGGGMGATLVYSQRFFDSPTVFAYILVMLGVGLVLEYVVVGLQRRLFGWASE